MKNKKIFFFLISLLSFCILMAEDAYSRQKSDLEKDILEIFDKLRMTGLGIAVVKNDSIIWKHSFGYKVLPENGKNGIELDDDDLFRIASISKTFIATAIMQLVENNELSLDEDAGKYLPFKLRNPYFPEYPITIKMLLTHTSGINDSNGWWSIDLINPDENTDYIKSYTAAKPGKNYKYCNLNYCILGAVIEGVTQERFDKIIKDKIIDPLNIYGSFNRFELDPDKFVKLYRYNEDTDTFNEDDEAYRSYKKQLIDDYKLCKSLGLEYPSSGMKISPSGLAKYMMMHMYDGSLHGIEIISNESEDLMRENYVGENNYGLSFRQYKGLIPGDTLYGQTGGGFGLKSAMIFNPKDKYGFVILCSGSSSKYIDGYVDIHKPLIKILYKHLISSD